jgi:hypothetical protein
LERPDRLLGVGQLLLQGSCVPINELRAQDNEVAVLLPGQCAEDGNGEGQDSDDEVLG